MKAIFRAGRIAFGAFFLYNGIHHFLDRQELGKYAASKAVPAPDMAVAGSGALLTAGGLNLIAGRNAGLGAGAIAIFLAIVSPFMHNFWNSRGSERQNELIHFSKNMALLAAAFVMATAREPRD